MRRSNVSSGALCSKYWRASMSAECSRAAERSAALNVNGGSLCSRRMSFRSLKTVRSVLLRYDACERALAPAGRSRKQAIARRAMGVRRGTPPTIRPNLTKGIPQRGILDMRYLICGIEDPPTGEGRPAEGGAAYAVASGGRLGTSTRRRNSQTVSSRWFQPMVSTVTMPRSGLLCDSRFSSTVVRA